MPIYLVIANEKGKYVLNTRRKQINRKHGVDY